jgi:predicted nuclease of predicted toxin-antitoxin system
MGKFLLDENIPRVLKLHLESLGHLAMYAAKGITNGRLAALSVSEDRVLVSRDAVLSSAKQFKGRLFKVKDGDIEQVS